MGKKLIVSDLDGTLLNSHSEGSLISSDLKNEIKKFMKKGNVFTIATGRPINTTEPIIKELDLDVTYIINYGAKIVDANGLELYYNDFELKEWLPYLNQFESLGATILVEVSNVVYYFNRTKKVEHFELKENVNCYQIQNDILNEGVRVFKILVIGNVEQYKELWETLDDQIKSKYRFIISEDDYFEVVKKDVSKGTALKFLKKYLKVEDDYVITVGNHMNDVELLEESSFGYAVNNANDGLKKVADFITDHEFGHGVLEVIQKHS